MNHFKMSFNNSRSIYSNNSYLAQHSPNISVLPKTVTPSIPLNFNMIGRVHNVKPGCSACGKKVA